MASAVAVTPASGGKRPTLLRRRNTVTGSISNPHYARASASSTSTTPAFPSSPSSPPPPRSPIPSHHPRRHPSRRGVVTTGAVVDHISTSPSARAAASLWPALARSSPPT
ncbi:hypothetical protein ABZP36_003062 [Zizania latifolia]